MLLQFEICLKAKKKKCRDFEDVKPHPELYHQLEEQVPESVLGQTFSVKNFLEFTFDHHSIFVQSKEICYPF